MLPVLLKSVRATFSNIYKKHLEENRVIKDTECCFKKQHSCSTTFHLVHCNVLDKLDNKDALVLIFFDFHNDFTTVNHHLSGKAAQIGIIGSALDIFYCFPIDANVSKVITAFPILWELRNDPYSYQLFSRFF